MLAYHVEWHLRRALAPLLFHDTDIAAARAERSSPVAKTEPSQTAKTKKAVKRNPAGQPVMDFADLIAHLGTLARNTVTTSLHKGHSFTLHTRPTAIQENRLPTARDRPRACPVIEIDQAGECIRINQLFDRKMKTSV